MSAAKFRCLGMVFVVVFSVVGSGAQEDHVVMTLRANMMQFLGIYAARDPGFCKHDGLDVKTILLPSADSL